MATKSFRRAKGTGRPPRLILRFGIYAGIAMLAAAFAAYFGVRHYATTGAEADTRDHTSYVASSVLPNELLRSDFAGPVSGGRRAELDRVARDQLLRSGVVRVKLYDPSGTVVYSSDHELIGTRPDDSEEVVEAAHGEAVSDVTTLDAEGGTAPDRKILESYVPIRIGGRTVGVLEFYSDYGVIANDAREIFLPVAIGIGVLLLLLYLSFFPILRRVTRTLEEQVAAIEYKAFHDDLTDLPNRAYFVDQIGAALLEAKQRAGRFAILLVDLSRFREVNDTLGHASGDRLLQSLAEDLPAALRPSDTVARLGGDEFGILAVRISDPTAVLALAEKLREVLGRPRTLDGVELKVDAGVGIAIYPEHGDDAITLLRRADVALHRSKEVGVPALYDTAHDRYSPARLGLLAELDRGIGNGEVVVYYQPQHEPASGRLRAVEALVRWEHPDRGLLMPDAFIPLAEHTSLIRKLTGYVLDAALAQQRAWAGDGLGLGIAVNISPRDLLDQGFPAEVQRLLERHDADPGRVELEVTENSAITDLPVAREILGRLHDVGVRLAIDDFGTGNSSLAYLRHLPIDVLKIDRSFVMRMEERSEDAAIVASTIALAHQLGLEVIAEGVETEASRASLAAWRCDLVQGFLFGRAVPGPTIATDASERTRTGA